MGDGFWQSSTTPFGHEAIAAMLMGAAYDGDLEGINGGIGQVLVNHDQFKVDMVNMFSGKLTVGQGYREKKDGDKDRSTYDFGVLREAIRNTTSSVSAPYATSDDAPGATFGTLSYIEGPFNWAGQMALELVRKRRKAIVTEDDGFLEREIGDASSGTLLSLIDPALTKTTGFVDRLVAKLTQNTTVWGTGAGTPDTLANMMGLSSYFSTLSGLVNTGVTFASVTVPTLTWVAPTGGSITAATVAAPTAVSVADNVDAAVESFTTLANTRLAADQAQLRASMFSTRQVMSTAFDGALAILAANAAAQIADYDKSARLDQARTQAQADMEHQRLSVQVNSQNAQLALDASKANSQFSLSAKDTETRFLLGAASAVTAAQSANNETGAIIMRARVDVLKVIYDTAASWMGAKAQLVTNAGPVASVINNAVQTAMSGTLADREAWTRHEVQKNDMASSMAGTYEGIAQLYWKSMIQNMMVLKEGVSAYQGIGGVEHHPSGFQKVESALGMVGGIASTIIQGVLAFS
jgi:hypothetical protein